MKLGPVVQLFNESKLKLLQSDKEGGFVVVPEGLFQERAGQAVLKNFRGVTGVELKKVKAQAVRLCGQLGLDNLKKSVSGAKGLNLEVFFTVKTHKVLRPFRAIFTQKDSWQLHVSSFLQRHLSLLKLDDPFLIRNSEALVEFLKKDNLGGCEFVSFDVEGMFYSIPHGELMLAVVECIEASGSVAFMNSTGVAVDSFLEFESEIYLQKSGICIGSSVAPVLSGIYLAKCDRVIARSLGCRVLRVFRYVDDYLVLYNDNPGPSPQGVCLDFLACFTKCSSGLSFKFETPS